MSILHEAFTGSGSTNVFEVFNHIQWVIISVFNEENSSGVYQLKFYDVAATPSWETFTTQTLEAGDSFEFRLSPGLYKLDTSTDEAGSANIHVSGTNIHLNVTDPLA